MADKYYEMPQEEANHIFDVLRESGSMNMMAGALVLNQHYNVSKFHAKQLLSTWLKTYNERHPRRENE